ncbi:hypothetical protein Fmac_025058 [Flemingia macrophylla]|uniref:Pectinesterase n=1 Tax=Flemingia macrophylla TaxID=520843 RepID=A0ABD1LSW0_9FABA
MTSKTRITIIEVTILLAFLTIQVASDEIPANKEQVESWFKNNVGPLNTREKNLDPALVTAEKAAKVVKVMQDGSGEFKTINDAIKSVPTGNTKRVILCIGVEIIRRKSKSRRISHSSLGEPKNMPNLTFGGTTQQYGTVDSATLIVESDYFVAANNSAPKPDGKRPGAQASALRISGDKATFYNCKIYGFQDTVCDDQNKHFFKDCLIQGTVDYIFGSGKTVKFGEYQNKGPGADPKGRSPLAHQLTPEEAKPYLTLDLIEGSKWILPPPTPKV